MPRPRTIQPGEGAVCNKCGEYRSPDEWLKSLKRPCKPCRNDWHRERRERLKRTAFEHYGAFCACCGEDTYEFLTFDHIDGGGNQERTINRKEPYTWERVIKENFPDRFQVLCFNCNWGKHKCGICPHERFR